MQGQGAGKKASSKSQPYPVAESYWLYWLVPALVAFLPVAPLRHKPSPKNHWLHAVFWFAECWATCWPTCGLYSRR
jgi:hypothetical protein